MYMIFGMASLGALIGIFAAWSASPIAATVLPLIFGLIGGATGFSLAKMDLTQAQNVAKLNFLGKALSALSLAAFGSNLQFGP